MICCKVGIHVLDLTLGFGVVWVNAVFLGSILDSIRKGAGTTVLLFLSISSRGAEIVTAPIVANMVHFEL